MKYILLILILLVNAAASLASSRVLYVKGVVKVASKKIKVGQTIKVGKTITTGKDSIAIISVGKSSKVKISENSQFKVEKLTKSRATTYLGRGQAFFSVLTSGKKRNKNTKFVVKTRSAIMGVRGTEFFVAHGKDKSNDIWMCVNKGEVLARSKSEKKSTSVKEGEGVVIKSGKNTSSPRALAWTRSLNWKMDPKKGNLVNKVSIDQAYSDILDQDYD